MRGDHCRARKRRNSQMGPTSDLIHHCETLHTLNHSTFESGAIMCHFTAEDVYITFSHHISMLIYLSHAPLTVPCLSGEGRLRSALCCFSICSYCSSSRQSQFMVLIMLSQDILQAVNTMKVSLREQRVPNHTGQERILFV